jgi:hypothetical protein
MVKQWEKVEKRTAKKTSGRRTPGSGNKWGFRGDIKGEIFLFEDKYTGKKSFSIKESQWKKIKKEALMESRRPAFKVTFESGTSFVVIDESDLYEIIDTIKMKGGELIK